jgi:ATP-dependent RNA helicase DDX46/PRP5
MDALARKILTRPLEITVGGRSVVAKEIDQRVEVRSAESKFLRLLEILGEMGEQFKDEDDFRTLIFVDRQESADDLFKELMRKGYICTSLHGGKDQVDRDQAIADFKAGFVPIVVATSVAARGLDVKELKLVINYDCPNHMEDYVHRAGRTGRAGNKGICITFITPDQERYSVDLQRALKASGAYIPPELQKMAEDFLAKVKEGKAKTAGSGFGGKGLDKFDAERDARDRAQRSAYGEDGAGPEKPADKAAGGAEGAGKEAAVPNIDFNVQIVKGPAPDKAPPAQPPATPKPLELGMDVSQLPPQTLAALQRAEAAGRGTNVKENLASAVAKIQATLRNAKAERNAAAGPGEKKAKDPDATDFHAIVPINDYPQKARWKATNKEQMVQLIELSGASITNKGELDKGLLSVWSNTLTPFNAHQVSTTNPEKSLGQAKSPSYICSSSPTRNSE